MAPAKVEKCSAPTFLCAKIAMHLSIAEFRYRQSEIAFNPVLSLIS